MYNITEYAHQVEVNPPEDNVEIATQLRRLADTDSDYIARFYSNDLCNVDWAQVETLSIYVSTNIAAIAIALANKTLRVLPVFVECPVVAVDAAVKLAKVCAKQHARLPKVSWQPLQSDNFTCTKISASGTQDMLPMPICSVDVGYVNFTESFKVDDLAVNLCPTATVTGQGRHGGNLNDDNAINSLAHILEHTFRIVGRHPEIHDRFREKRGDDVTPQLSQAKALVNQLHAFSSRLRK